jgi:hypothetical protein
MYDVRHFNVSSTTPQCHTPEKRPYEVDQWDLSTDCSRSENTDLAFGFGHLVPRVSGSPAVTSSRAISHETSKTNTKISST